MSHNWNVSWNQAKISSKYWWRYFWVSSAGKNFAITAAETLLRELSSRVAIATGLKKSYESLAILDSCWISKKEEKTKGSGIERQHMSTFGKKCLEIEKFAFGFLRFSEVGDAVKRHMDTQKTWIGTTGVPLIQNSWFGWQLHKWKKKIQKKILFGYKFIIWS